MSGAATTVSTKLRGEDKPKGRWQCNVQTCLSHTDRKRWFASPDHLALHLIKKHGETVQSVYHVKYDDLMGEEGRGYQLPTTEDLTFSVDDPDLGMGVMCPMCLNSWAASFPAFLPELEKGVKVDQNTNKGSFTYFTELGLCTQ